MNLSDHEIECFRLFGWALLHNAFASQPLSEELDHALRDGYRHVFTANAGEAEITGQYVPMMCERTPVSLSLIEQFAEVAAALLGTAVLPVRAKGVLYPGMSAWHTDSMHDVASVGFAAYLEPLDGSSGALRVLPGSHRADFGNAVAASVARRGSVPADQVDTWVRSLPGYVLATEPGDVIAFDEHLFHASTGGRNRRQWRVDYVAALSDPGAEQRLRDYFSSQYLPDWDGGYDVDMFPSYGP